MELFGAFFAVVISLLSILYAYFKYSFDYWNSKGVHYDEPSIPFGCIKGFGRTVHPSQYMTKLYNKFKPLGAKFCGTYAFARPIAVLIDIELVKSVLVKDFDYFDERGGTFDQSFCVQFKKVYQ